MDKYLKNNKDLWNEFTPIHERFLPAHPEPVEG